MKGKLARGSMVYQIRLRKQEGEMSVKIKNEEIFVLCIALYHVC